MFLFIAVFRIAEFIVKLDGLKTELGYSHVEELVNILHAVGICSLGQLVYLVSSFISYW